MTLLKVDVYDLLLYFVFKLLKHLVSSLIWFIDSYIIRWRMLCRIEGYVNCNGYGCILVENFEIYYWFQQCRFIKLIQIL